MFSKQFARLPDNFLMESTTLAVTCFADTGTNREDKRKPLPKGLNKSSAVESYLIFHSMERLGVFLLPPGWDASLSQGYPALN